MFSRAPDVDHEVRWYILKLADILVRPNEESLPTIKITIPSTPANEVAPWEESFAAHTPSTPSVVLKPTISLPRPKLKLTPSASRPGRSEPPESPLPVTPVPASPAPKVKVKPLKPPGPPRHAHLPPKALSGGMLEGDLKACRSALKALQTIKHSQFFRIPVDPIRDQAPE